MPVGVAPRGHAPHDAREHERAERPAVGAEPAEVTRDVGHRRADAQRLERDDRDAHEHADAHGAEARREDAVRRAASISAGAAGAAPARRSARGGRATPPRCGAASARRRRPRARAAARAGAGRRPARRTRARPPRAASRSKTLPPSSGASARAGGNDGAPPSRIRRVTAGPHVGDLPGEELRRALEQPRPAQPAHEPARAERRRHARVVGGDVAAREERRRGEHQQLQRALDVRGALREQPRREHVELTLAGPADQVAPRGGRGHPPLERERGRGGVEHRRRAVHDHDELAGRGREALVQAVARVLELADDRRDVRGVAVLVAHEERVRCDLLPGHALHADATGPRPRRSVSGGQA